MVASETEARIGPLEPPFTPSVGALLERMMPTGVPPIALFRTFAHNEPMTDAMYGWGSYELSRRLSVPLRARELVIDRVTARLGCEYEWGVHVAFYAEAAGFTSEQVRSLAHGLPADACWDDNDRVVLQLVDALIDTADIDDHLWADLASQFSVPELLDLILLTGWYHAIAFAANAARVPLEEGAPRFADYTPAHNPRLRRQAADALPNHVSTRRNPLAPGPSEVEPSREKVESK
jgi:alkylhydroperoxidase family enzyme